jgi:YHS domain-containing protein
MLWRAIRRSLSDKGIGILKKKEKTMANTVKDPVCGMDIDPNTAAGKSEYKGTTYYFCSLGCKKSFDKEPEKYVNAAAPTHQH